MAILLWSNNKQCFINIKRFLILHKRSMKRIASPLQHVFQSWKTSIPWYFWKLIGGNECRTFFPQIILTAFYKMSFHVFSANFQIINIEVYITIGVLWRGLSVFLCFRMIHASLTGGVFLSVITLHL